MATSKPLEFGAAIQFSALFGDKLLQKDESKESKEKESKSDSDKGTSKDTGKMEEKWLCPDCTMENLRSSVNCEVRVRVLSCFVCFLVFVSCVFCVCECEWKCCGA